jgi:hypothetical protein
MRTLKTQKVWGRRNPLLRIAGKEQASARDDLKTKKRGRGVRLKSFDHWIRTYFVSCQPVPAAGTALNFGGSVPVQSYYYYKLKIAAGGLVCVGPFEAACVFLSWFKKWLQLRHTVTVTWQQLETGIGCVVKWNSIVFQSQMIIISYLSITQFSVSTVIAMMICRFCMTLKLWPDLQFYHDSLAPGHCVNFIQIHFIF